MYVQTSWYFRKWFQDFLGSLYVKTLCKYECMILSHDGSKILTACRMLQISIAHRQMKAKIHSFPTMYILGGVDVVEMGQIKVFVQELGLKTSISAERNLDLLTLAGSGTHKFWSVATFDTTPQKFGEFRSKWAMGMSGSFKIVPTQASYIFSTSGPQKTKKRVLFAFRPITPMQKFLRGIQGCHMKANIPPALKIWWLLLL